MILFKKTYLTVLLAFVFIGCTEIYKPNINTTTEALVVEGMITDGVGPFTIKLSKTLLFNSDLISNISYVTGAKLTVNDNENNTFLLTDAGKGSYILPLSFKAKIGNSYKLHIETKDGLIYESNFEKLFHPQPYDSIRGFYITDKYPGESQFNTTKGADVRVDLFKSISNIDSIPSCRFNTNMTVQYEYYIQNDSVKWYWSVYGWKSVDLNLNENIIEGKSLTTSAFVQNHSLCFVPYGMPIYGCDIPPQGAISTDYYLRVNQYTMNRDSYNFYEGANKQLAANSKIFDPISSQLICNMKCINNTSKIVLGLFEVSSINKTAFLIYWWDNKVTLRKVPYLEIPTLPVYFKSLIDNSIIPNRITQTNPIQYKVWIDGPYKKEYKDSINYIVIPKPSWWYHN
jgi:hypothetical protein